MDALPTYAELHAVSNYTFLRGASRPEELIERAHSMGYEALAITDECSLAGVVRAYVQTKETPLKLLIGSEFLVQAPSPFRIVVLAQNRNGYGNLSQFITKLRRASTEKGQYSLSVDQIDAVQLEDCVVLLVPDRLTRFDELFIRVNWLQRIFAGRCWLAVELLHSVDDQAWLFKMRRLQALTAIQLVAAGDVHMHVRSRKPLQDVLTATRLRMPLHQCGEALQPNAERHVRSRLRLANLYPEDLLAATIEVANLCSFRLDELKYDYPDEVVPTGMTPASYLRQIAYEGAGRRFPTGVPAKVQNQIEHELELITELKYEKYFLTVYDIVRFARSRQILCQGRGSAANSAVCYCIGVTEVDPARSSVLFERFISRERNEPPDIDIDFEHQRREEVMQYLYERYGRHRAALTATVISYRTRSAIRDVGKALGFDLATVEKLANSHQWWDGGSDLTERLKECGLDPDDLGVVQWVDLVGQIKGFPRHLSQHTGGFVISGGPLSRLVPIENASMVDRTVVQWDKDDLDALGLLKVDVLALGMLSAIRRALEFISLRRGYVFEMQDIPDGCQSTYDMICQADTVGVFQIESRAQQSMLPRLKPRCFYDLVVEVAIVRPGPIQGGMVHPYLRRREGTDPVVYPSEALKEALGRTLGVPIFQEQVMQVAMLAAGFSAGEADGLRRAMAAWRKRGGLEKYYDRIVEGMQERGYDLEFAKAIFEQIKGFGEYGFPESHAASFALLVYASCWIKCNEPAAFLAAMLNSQPLGFYTPSQLVQDAQRHGVEVRPVDVSYSDVPATFEDLPHRPAVRLGFNMIVGMRSESLQRIVEVREAGGPFADAQDLASRACLSAAEMKALAAADALQSLAGHRRQQVWDAAALHAAPQLLRGVPINEDILELDAAPEGEEIVFDYASLGLTLRSHPMSLLRPIVAKRKMLTSSQLRDLPDGRLVRACGLVTVRQQPDTAKGTVFVSLEDEDGAVQVIIGRSERDRFREALLQSRLLAVYGVWQKRGEIRNLIARRLENWNELLGRLQSSSRDFR